MASSRVHRALIVGAFAAGLAACGDDAVATACKAQCDAQSNATGCAAGFNKSKYASDCQTGCDLFVGLLKPDCKTKAQASYDCGKNAVWACSTGGTLPQPAGMACQTENSAFASCGI